jgi:hypothetical protein
MRGRESDRPIRLRDLQRTRPVRRAPHHGPALIPRAPNAECAGVHPGIEEQAPRGPITDSTGPIVTRPERRHGRSRRNRSRLSGGIPGVHASARVLMPGDGARPMMDRSGSSPHPDGQLQRPQKDHENPEQIQSLGLQDDDPRWRGVRRARRDLTVVPASLGWTSSPHATHAAMPHSSGHDVGRVCKNAHKGADPATTRSARACVVAEGSLS